MKIEGSEFLPASATDLRSLLSDPAVLRRLLPGSVSLAAVAPEEYRVEIQQRLGPYDDLFSGILALSWDDIDSRLDISADLESPNGLVTIAGNAELQPEGDKGTLLRYRGTVETDGRLATVSPRMLKTTANATIRRLLEALGGEVAGKPLFPLQRETTATAQSEGENSGVRVPASILVLLAGLVGIVLMRLWDNRRINRLRSSESAADSSGSGPE